VGVRRFFFPLFSFLSRRGPRGLFFFSPRTGKDLVEGTSSFLLKLIGEFFVFLHPPFLEELVDQLQ